MLDSLPRLRLSEAQMRTIIFVLREAGVKNVPSLKTLHRVQEKLRKQVGYPTVRHVSPRGNVFYVNDIKAQVAKVCVFLYLSPSLITDETAGLCKSHHPSTH